MENQNTNQQFREEEITNIRRWDKEKNEYVYNPFPKIGGRLRLAHEANKGLSIETEIVKYDERLAVVSATTRTDKGSFKGIGMASVERDEKLASAILELAETRAIARALRFAGYGVEYCGAEEVGNLNGNGDGSNGQHTPGSQGNGSPPRDNGGNGGHNPGNGSGNPGNGNGRLSSKQFNFLTRLSADLGKSKYDLEQECLEKYGAVPQHLNKHQASEMIAQLLSQ